MSRTSLTALSIAAGVGIIALLALMTISVGMMCPM